jgi:hypothetical protein
MPDPLILQQVHPRPFGNDLRLACGGLLAQAFMRTKAVSGTATDLTRSRHSFLVPASCQPGSTETSGQWTNVLVKLQNAGLTHLAWKLKEFASWGLWRMWHR